jgi:hypothetical protein
MPMTDQISVWCSQCGAQWYCDLEDSPAPDRRRLVLDPILCESCAAEVRGQLEARIERLRNVADAAYELIYHPASFPTDDIFANDEWLRTQLDHLEPGDLTDNGSYPQKEG